MANIEEEIKAFLSDKENIKALMNDEKFMDAVSGGQASPETYKERFKKFGLEFSDDEAKVIQKTVTKAIDTPTEKLDDSLLESITGGGKGAVIGVALGAIGGGVAVELGGLGCMIAAHIYAAKAERAYKNGNYDDCAKYNAKSDRCGNIGVDLASFGITAALRKHKNK